MDHSRKEKRQFERFETDKEVFFTVSYEIRTKVNFQIVDQKSEKILPPKYPAISRNVSAPGVCFSSLKQLETGDLLILEVYALESREPIFMEGEVKWSRPAAGDEGRFETGVQIMTVEGRRVEETFYHDERHRVVWSAVLESVLGNFRGNDGR